MGNTRYDIPNTLVKTQTADGTMLVTAWKSRWMPESSEDYGLNEKNSPKTYRSRDSGSCPVIRALSDSLRP